MAKKKRGTSKTNLHQRPKGRPPGWVWFITALFAVVIIAVIIDPQCQPGSSVQPPPPNSGPNLTGKFVREGTLTFYSPSESDTTAVDTVTIEIEIADDPDSRTVGMMYRKTMRPDRGMLFVFDELRIQSFWMQNTPLSLDMIFVGADSTIVTIYEHTQPYSRQSHTSTAPAQHVIEVVAGFCEKHGIEVGDRISWQRD